MRTTSISKRRGFTIVEVLITIGVISLMIAILLPVLNRAREQSRRATCASNLHTILQANQAYFMHNGYLANWGDLYDTNQYNASCGDSSVFLHNANGYIRYGQLIEFGGALVSNFRCPSSMIKGTSDDGIDPRSFGASGAIPPQAIYGSYALRGTRQGAPLRPVDMGKMTALISDFEFRHISPLVPPDVPKIFAHRDGLNVAYTDGHVQFVPGNFDSFYFIFGGDSHIGGGDGTWSKLDKASH